MNTTYRFLRFCRTSAAIVLATLLLATPLPAFDIYTDLPPALAPPYDSNSEIHIHSAADANALRTNVVNYLWNGAGLPSKAATTVSTGSLASYPDMSLLNPAYIAGVEKWQANMDYGYSTTMYLLHPSTTNANNNRLAIVHHGHAGYSQRFIDGIGTLTDHLLQNGFTVLEMGMPLYSWNSTTATFNLPSGSVNLTSHNQIVSSLEGQGGSSLRFFLEPVVQGINKFIQTNASYTDVSMTGISGGGWTTTLAAAVDPRIKINIPVAGSLPISYRNAYAAATGSAYNDDAEQTLAAMYTNHAGYMDLYALDGYGTGRNSIQLNNQYDNCCFYGISSSTYANNVHNAVVSTGAGNWNFYLDTTCNTHQISSNAVYNVMDPALGISPAKPAAPSINEQFSAASTPPTGWRYDPMNGGTPTISSSGGLATFPAGNGVKSIVGNSSFNPQRTPITATMKINSIGSGGYLGFFFTEDPYARTHLFGLQVNSSGTLLLATDHGASFKNYTLTTLNGYSGGPITLTLTFDANGFTAATDVNNYSVTHPYSWLTSNKFSLKDLGMEVFPFMQYYDGSGVGRVDSFTVVPEPSGHALLLSLGAAGLIACAWRRRTRARHPAPVSA